MAFTLPEVHEIEAVIDGRRFEGAYYFVLGDLIVNYNGFTTSVRKPAADVRKVALNMFRDLVREHYVPLDAIPTELPQPIREAAHAFLNSFDDDRPTENLVASFGDSTLGSHVHTQLSWLCINVLEPIVPFWKYMCDDDAPEQKFRELRNWLNDPSCEVDWSSACQPDVALSDGVVVADCDACRLKPIARAVAKTAEYLRTADSWAAAKAILSACSAYDEGCQPSDAPGFEQWVVFDVLPASFRCEACATRESRTNG